MACQGEFLIDALSIEQHREKAAGGAFLFGYFILGKQNKVTCREAKNIIQNTFQLHQNALMTIPEMFSQFLVNVELLAGDFHAYHPSS